MAVSLLSINVEIIFETSVSRLPATNHSHKCAIIQSRFLSYALMPPAGWTNLGDLRRRRSKAWKHKNKKEREKEKRKERKREKREREVKFRKTLNLESEISFVESLHRSQLLHKPQLLPLPTFGPSATGLRWTRYVVRSVCSFPDSKILA